MIEHLKHIYRSLKTFRVNIFVLVFQFFKQDKQIDASLFIQNEDFSGKNFKAWVKLDNALNIHDIKKELKWNTEQWTKHNFDLLGTGWVSRNLNTKPVGFLGYTIPEESDTIKSNSYNKSILSERASGLINENYLPIDWQRDIKSGYRWDEKLDSQLQSNFLKMPYGVDVKIPWELARLNHLPLLIISARYELNNQKDCLWEFRNIVCDFIAANPYKKGINWANAMEAGIRIVNILLAFDFAKELKEHKDILDPVFESVLFDSVYQHTEFLLENSEFKRGYTNNHYYANISALLFISSYFISSENGKKLFNIAAREVFIESKKQFLIDGGNFEASTHYHRLCSEMLLWNCIIINENKSNKIALAKIDLKWNNKFESLGKFELELDELMIRAQKALDFSKSITKPNGNIAACGDQDSGRYLKFSLEGNWKTFNELKKSDHQISSGNYNWADSESLWLENDLSQQSLLALGKNILDNEDIFLNKYPFEMELSKYLTKDTLEEIPNIKPKSVKFGDLLHWHTSTIFYSSEIEDLKKNLEWHLYPKFGIYIAKSQNFFLSINATNNHLKKYWTHGKNDKLSFELQVNGKDIIVDPGSFIYSADEKLRNKFRSTFAHSTISVKEKEQNRWPKGKRGVFNLYNESRCKFLSQIDNRISLLCEYRGIKHLRTFVIHNDHLEIVDECTEEFQTHFNYLKLYSDHYGRWRKTENES